MNAVTMDPGRGDGGSAPSARSEPCAAMSKLLLLSILIASIALPAKAAREKNPRKGLRKTIVYVLLFNVFYLFGLMFLYGRI